jgi:N-acetyl-gamma-glutamyl-phosphate reductase
MSRAVASNFRRPGHQRNEITNESVMSTPRVFIDGQHGTTGIRIASLLERRADLELVRIDEAARKDPAARADCLRAADVAILCLPDTAAAQAISLARDTDTRLIDTSSARRTDPDWVYGLPEMSVEQRDAIRDAPRVANPGCYPQTVILALRPLFDAGKLSPEHPFTVNAVSGYSGGGRQMVEAYQGSPATAGGEAAMPLCLYGLGMDHKHLPEMHRFSGARHVPLFIPSVDHRYCGMLVSIPLPAAWLNGLDRDDVHAIWSERYEGEPLVGTVSPAESDESLRDGRFLDLPGEEMGNRLELSVYGSAGRGLVLVGRLDNLGKGAAGNAVQCLNLMLGIDESRGLLASAHSAAA